MNDIEIMQELKLKISQLEEENKKLKNKVKELIQYEQDFDNYGRNYNLIFRTIKELKEMVGIK